MHPTARPFSTSCRTMSRRSSLLRVPWTLTAYGCQLRPAVTRLYRGLARSSNIRDPPGGQAFDDRRSPDVASRRSIPCRRNAMDLSRRDFLASGAVAAGGAALGDSAAVAAAPLVVAQAVSSPAARGFDPADPALKFDLVLANADVLDPS